MSAEQDIKRSALYVGTLKALDKGLMVLPDKPEETPENTADALWLFVQGNPTAVTRTGQQPLLPLSEEEEQALTAAVARRLGGEPLAHITGRQEFMGITLLAGRGALIPRKETEILGRLAARELADLAQSVGGLLCVDVCTGAGNLALALAGSAPTARMFGADISEDAIALAKMNATFTNLADRVEFRAGDLLAPFDHDEFLGRVHMLCCNPPYISSARVEKMDVEISDHEPREAFDGGPFGIAILGRLIKEAPRFLVSGGRLCFEVGLGQGPAMARRLAGSEFFGEIHTAEDGDGKIRAISAARA